MGIMSIEYGQLNSTLRIDLVAEDNKQTHKTVSLIKEKPFKETTKP